jgi:hypothetical protein
MARGPDTFPDFETLGDSTFDGTVAITFTVLGSLVLGASPTLTPSRCLLFSLPPILTPADSRALDEPPILTLLLPRGMTVEMFRSVSPTTSQQHIITVTHATQPFPPSQYLLFLLLEIAFILILISDTVSNNHTSS